MLFKKTYKLATMLAVMGALTGHAASDIDLNSIGYFSFTPLPAELQAQKDTLLLSDSPEYVGPVGGVLSAGSINGKGRIYFYHVNEMAEPHKIAIILENTGNEPNGIAVFRELKSIATSDYFAAGRDLSRKELEQPLTDKPLYSFVMPPKSRQLVFTDLEHSPIPKDALFTGIVDLQTSAPVFARVMMIPMNLNSIESSYWVNNLPIDHVRLRGTFTGAEREMAVTKEYNTTLGGAYVELGNDREDRFVEGVDELDNKAYVKDAGNYGISYTVKIPTSGEDPFRLYFNPLGGGYSGSFTVKAQRRWQKAPSESMTYHIGGDDGLMALGHNTVLDSRYMGNYYGGDTLTIDFMPAGASNLPVRFLLIPEALANPQYARVLATNEAGQRALEAEAQKEAAEAAKKVAIEEKYVAAKTQKEEQAHQLAEAAKLAAEKAAAAHKAAQDRQAELDKRDAEEQAKLKAKADAAAERARAKAEADRQLAEQKAKADAQKAEAARIAAEQKAKDDAAKAEAARIAAEQKAKADAQKAEAARIAAEQKAKDDAASVAAEQAAREKAEREQAAREAAEQKAREYAAKLEAQRLEAQRKAAIEAARQDSIAKAEAELLAARTQEATPDSIKQAAGYNQYGLLAVATAGAEEQVELANGKIALKLSTKGGAIREVLLRDYKTHDGKPLYLFREGESDFNLPLRTLDNRLVDTRDLYFSPISRTDSSVVMRLAVDSASYLDLAYVLLPDDYRLRMTVSGQNLQSLFPANMTMQDLEWSQRIRRQEKSWKFENQYTSIYYKYSGDEVDRLSDSKQEDKKTLEEPLHWVSFKDKYFASVLVCDSYFENNKLAQKTAAAGSD